ncbi:hypothetical protein H2200_002870 [Cladophialophora chaetospira]|uniref:EthD domain-containing protein n=1 Tax=Cladophialophora chaetospira TaxID=386627 RepID=A0AA38XGC9_9EURO|nr:hypothetical protein H2200_002870 [Cladophialophora chaetospira]
MAQLTLSPVQVTVFIKRKPGMSEEEFHKYWTEVHAPLVEEWLAKHGGLRYVQHHTPSWLRQQVSAAWAELGASPNMADYDGIGEVTVRNIQDLKTALEDLYYRDRVVPDQLAFMDTNSTILSAGWAEVKVDNGSVIRTTLQTRGFWV